MNTSLIQRKLIKSGKEVCRITGLLALVVVAPILAASALGVLFVFVAMGLQKLTGINNESGLIALSFLTLLAACGIWAWVEWLLDDTRR